ncbi:hypothetical protein D3C71_1072470 [compost metagenome]
MLGQQARGVERLDRATVLPRGLEAQPQRQRAALRALRQFFEPCERGRRVAVVERPARGAQLHAFAGFGAREHGAVGAFVEGLLQVGVARGLVLQGLRAFGGQQVRQHAHLLRLRQLGAERGQCLFLRERSLRGLAGAREAAGDQLHHRIEQGGVQHAFLLLQPPVARLRGQREQRRERAQRDVQQHEGQQQDHEHEVQREIDPPRRPEHGDRALVVAGEQRHRRSDGEQREEPDCSAHERISALRPRWSARPACRRCAPAPCCARAAAVAAAAWPRPACGARPDRNSG